MEQNNSEFLNSIKEQLSEDLLKKELSHMKEVVSISEEERNLISLIRSKIDLFKQSDETVVCDVASSSILSKENKERRIVLVLFEEETFEKTIAPVLDYILDRKN